MSEVIRKNQEEKLFQKRECCKGHYRLVTRDGKGKIVSVRKWTNKKRIIWEEDVPSKRKEALQESVDVIDRDSF